MQLKLFLAMLVLLSLSLLPGACAKICGGGEWLDITWKLESYGLINDLQPVLANSNISLKFDGKSKEISGSGGCNHYFGSYSVKSNCELQITKLTVTLIGCLDSALTQQEQKYFNLLQNADKIEVSNEELRISSNNEILVYTR